MLTNQNEMNTMDNQRKQKLSFFRKPVHISASILQWLPVALILTVSVIAFSNSFSGQFVLDDGNNIYLNPSIQSIGDSFSPPESVNIFRRQAVNFTLALNYAISGHQVWSYHAFNLLFHILAALTLYGVVRQAFQSKPLAKRYGASAPWLASFTATLWAAHPLQTQSVTYIIQRCESLAGMCVLAIVYFSIKSMKSQKPWPWRTGAFTFFLLGIWVKESIFLGPLLTLFYDRTFISGNLRTGLRENKSLYMGFAVCLLIFGLNILAFLGSDATQLGHSPLTYALAQPEVIVRYLKLAVWPTDLMLSYHWLPTSIGKALPYLLFITPPILVSIYLAAIKNRYGFFLCWFWITLAPTSSFFPINDLIFEQRMYLPLAGLIGFAIMAGYDCLGWLKEKTGQNMFSLGIIMWAFVITACIIRTYDRNTDYTKGELYMWQDVLTKQPDNIKALSLVGKGLAQLNRSSEALTYYHKALEMNPDSFVIHNDLAILYDSLGDQDQAETHLRKMISINPSIPLPYLSLAKMMMQQREIPEAVLLLEKAVELNSDLVTVHAQLAQIYVQSGQLSEAVPHLEAYLAKNPDNTKAKQMLQAIQARQ